MIFVLVLATHVIVAVVGIGLVGAVPIVARLARLARSARRDGQGLAAKRPLLEVLLRVTRWGLAIMAVTAVLLDVAAGGAFHAAGWFRASAALFVLLGFSHARARAALRKSQGADPGNAELDASRDEDTLRRIERWGWTMYATVALLAALMALKPFP
jgi:hypothetical protein